MVPPEERIAAHEASAERVTVDGVATAVWTDGAGEPVLCFHGVPVSAWLYRNLLPALAEQGLRGIAFDLPGFGLADRPPDFAYTWTAFGRFAVGLVDRLGLSRVHLVVHDIGGPVGFELASALPDRVASITVLDTLVRAAEFRKPWVMRPFEIPGIRSLWLHGMVDAAFVRLMYAQGISDRAVVPPEEILVHKRLLLRTDRGRGFLKTMGRFETTAAKQTRYLSVFDHARPVEAIWGARDPALTLGGAGRIVRDLVGAEHFHEVDGKHFLPETHAASIARTVAGLVARS